MPRLHFATPDRDNPAETLGEALDRLNRERGRRPVSQALEPSLATRPVPPLRIDRTETTRDGFMIQLIEAAA